MIDIQNTVLEHQARGVSQKWVYENIVWPTYRISERTYYYYLGHNAKLELKRLECCEKMQTTMF